jgi:3-oxoadipate enol-lactonase
LTEEHPQRRIVLKNHTPDDVGGQHIVFIHGIGSNGRIWEHQIAHLQSRYRLWTAELCGHGEAPPLPHSLLGDLFRFKKPSLIAEMVRDLADLMTENQIVDALLVGHSLGGTIAILLAAAYPDKVKGLVLVDTPVYQKANMLQKGLALRTISRQFKRTLQGIYSVMCENPEVGKRVVETCLQTDKHSFINLMQEVIGMNYSGVLEKVQVPILLALGSRMAKSKEALPNFLGAQGYDSMANKRVAYREDVGHFIMLEQPQWLNDQIDAFLQEIL